MERFAAVVLVLAGLVSPAVAGAIEARYELGLYSHYAWRGLTLTDGPVLQPELRILHPGGLSVGAWGNVDLGDESETQAEFDELRLTIDYAWRPDPFEIGVGLVEYLFPGTPFPSTREVYVRFELPSLVSPRLTLYRDLEAIEGTYAELAVAYDHELGRWWRSGVELSVGYADRDFAVGGVSGFHDGNLTVELEYVGDRFSAGLRAGYTDSMDQRVLFDQAAGSWFGLTLGRGF
jgi:uncharacterized protein (TIGR02001 family)